MTKKKKKISSIYLTYKDIATWFFLFIFVSACMFALGVFIGRHTGPALFTFEDHQETTDSFEMATIDESPGDLDVDPSEVLDWLSEKGDDISAFIDESKKIITVSKADPGIKKNNMPKGLAIQVAGFKTRTSAYRMIEKLRKKRYPAYLSMGEGAVHNVRIGKFKTMADARKALKKLNRDNIQAIIVTP